MNFDTKYLIRWGIPGWILLLTLMPYFVVILYETLPKEISDKNVLALGAAITLSGVPLGYFFNQIHHLFGWVVKENWDNYFDEEVIVDEFLCKDANKGYQDRYRYLLTKKHEVGSVYVSFIVSTLVIMISNFYFGSKGSFGWVYFVLVFAFAVSWHFLRAYASRNIDKYFAHLKIKASE